MVIFFPWNPAGSKFTESSLKFYAIKNKNGEFLSQNRSCRDWAKVSVRSSKASGKGPLNQRVLRANLQ